MNDRTKSELVVYLGGGFLLAVLIQLSWLWQKNFSLAGTGGLWGGFILGSFLLDSDQLIYWFVTFPREEKSIAAQRLWREKKFRLFFDYLINNRREQGFLIFHHFYFQIATIVLGAFIFTSTGAVFARSLIVFVSLHFAIDQGRDLLTRPAYLQKWLFARMRRRLPVKFLKYYFAFSLFVFLVFVSGLAAYH